MGFSGQSVPSLSKTAMRSGAGTKVGDVGFVTLSTKWRIADLVSEDFQLGRGSASEALPRARCASKKKTPRALKTEYQLKNRAAGVDVVFKEAWKIFFVESPTE
jgi:hypothetical protein